MRLALTSALLVMLAAVSGSAGAMQGDVTAADAAPYLGDWTLALEGANGPGTFNVTLKVDNDKVTGTIGGDRMETQTFTTVTKAAKGLSLSFSFPYEGLTVDALVSLLPPADGKADASIDFAGGAYTMSGSATKKDAAK
jgi:hypothetical protein